jgi:hypothetical protein
MVERKVAKMSVREQSDSACKLFWMFALGGVAGLILGAVIGYGVALPVLLEDQWVCSMFIGQEAWMSK